MDHVGLEPSQHINWEVNASIRWLAIPSSTDNTSGARTRCWVRHVPNNWLHIYLLRSSESPSLGLLHGTSETSGVVVLFLVSDRAFQRKDQRIRADFCHYRRAF